MKEKDSKKTKQKAFKGTPDYNIPPATLGGRIMRTVWSYIVITFGTLLIAIGIYFFKFPNHFTVGGVSSLAVIVAKLFPMITESQFMAIANIALLIVALLVFGKGFAIKTIYSSVLLSVITLVFEKLYPVTESITGDRFLELILTIGGIAVGSAILFSQGASSGGTDIIAMILRKFTTLNIGSALLVSDALMVVASLFTFGIEIFIYSLVGLVLKSFIVDTVIDGINLNKCFIIFTSCEDLVCDFIKNELHRGATISDCKGSFSRDDKKMIVTVLNRTQASYLKAYLKESDPTAFTVITNTSDILGKGFRIV